MKIITVLQSATEKIRKRRPRIKIVLNILDAFRIVLNSSEPQNLILISISILSQFKIGRRCKLYLKSFHKQFRKSETFFGKK